MQHGVAQSCVSLNVLQIATVWFLIYFKLDILSSFHTSVKYNLCLLRKICQYLKTWLNTFRSKKFNYFQWYNFKKGLKKRKVPFFSPPPPPHTL